MLIEHHMRPGQAAAPGQPPTARALYRLHQVLGDATPDACFLFLADSLGTAGTDVLVPDWPAYIAHAQEIACWRPPPAAEEVRRLADGNAVMAATGLRPGPVVGWLLAAIEEAAAIGDIATPDAALALANRLAKESPHAE